MRRTPLLLTALVMSLVLAPPASADLFTDVVRDYIKDSRLDVCSYTTEQLKKIKDAVPVDQNAYTPEFIAAVDDAIARRAEGACNTERSGAAQGGGAAPAGGASGGAAAPPGTPAAGGGTPGGAANGTAAPGQGATTAKPPPTPAAEPVPAPGVPTDAIAVAAQTEEGGGDAPFPLVALAILAGLLALGALLAGLVRWSAWEPEWAHRMRHATGEAGWRASSTWAEFADFVRFGR
jgi:hypothetical protein